jgi:hypothetical protein
LNLVTVAGTFSYSKAAFAQDVTACTIAVRWKFDEDMIDTNDVVLARWRQCCSIDLSSDEEDVFVVWWMKRRLKKKTIRKCWVHPYFN